MCPTIFGHELVKAGLLLGLFGGSSYRSRAQEDLAGNNTHSRGGGDKDNASGQSSAEAGAGVSSREFKVRADIHVLIVGDPGLGKVRQRNSIEIIFQTMFSKYVFALHRVKCFGRRPPSPPVQCSFAETPPPPQDSQFLSPEIPQAEAKVAHDFCLFV
jgi:DNA replicative helicase MCM subunit Mcm2 (Cdc46/Mcm family)